MQSNYLIPCNLGAPESSFYLITIYNDDINSWFQKHGRHSSPGPVSSKNSLLCCASDESDLTVPLFRILVDLFFS